MANARKLPSGSWRVLVYDYTDKDGKRHYKSFTADTKSAAEYFAAKWRQEKPERDKMRDKVTVGDAVDKYIGRTKKLSPTTLARYQNIRAYGLQSLMAMEINDLTSEICQSEIDKETDRPNRRTGKPISAKTVREEWALVSSALKAYGCSFDVDLPEIPKKHKELPPPEQVLQAIRGTDIELPCLLAIWLSFSLSEIRGFKASSVRGGRLYVDQVVVQVEGLDVEKEDTKTKERKRFQSVPPHIMHLIQDTPAYQQYQETGTDGYLCPVTENVIYHRLQKILKDAGIPAISFHDLRHMFASIMLTRLQIPEKVVQEEGGWSTPHIMQSVYNNVFSDSRQQADEIRDKYFEDALTTSHGSPQT